MMLLAMPSERCSLVRRCAMCPVTHLNPYACTTSTRIVPYRHGSRQLRYAAVCTLHPAPLSSPQYKNTFKLLEELQLPSWPLTDFTTSGFWNPQGLVTEAPVFSKLPRLPTLVGQVGLVPLGACCCSWRAGCRALLLHGLTEVHRVMTHVDVAHLAFPPVSVGAIWRNALA